MEVLAVVIIVIAVVLGIIWGMADNGNTVGNVGGSNASYERKMERLAQTYIPLYRSYSDEQLHQEQINLSKENKEILSSTPATMNTFKAEQTLARQRALNKVLAERAKNSNV